MTNTTSPLIYGKVSRSYQKLDNSVWRDRLQQMQETCEEDPLSLLLIKGGYIGAQEFTEARDVAASLNIDLLKFLSNSGWLPDYEVRRVLVLSDLLKNGRITEWMALRALAGARQYNLTIEHALERVGWRS